MTCSHTLRPRTSETLIGVRLMPRQRTAMRCQDFENSGQIIMDLQRARAVDVQWTRLIPHMASY